MIIKSVSLKNFRNFANATINFESKSLIIGANEVGKSNLIHALRILLDKSLNAYDLDPKDSDFNSEKKENNFEIDILFSDIDEDCITATFRGKISDQGMMHLVFQANREDSGKKSYEILAGKDRDSLEPVASRFYLKHLNLEYVQSNRDLTQYLKREKRHLFEEKKGERSQQEITADLSLIENIEKNLSEINKDVSGLSYIKKSKDIINQELNELLPDADTTKVAFTVGEGDPEDYVNKVSLTAETHSEMVAIGGDGRNNQIFLSLWSARKGQTDVEAVTIHCIEEPEAHLHPHNQRNLSNYLYRKFKGQLIMTSHSPQIACEFSPNSIVKLLKKTAHTSVAASDGCSDAMDDTFEEFSYRLDLLPAEAFFANVVLLVEGPSEILLYKAISKSIGVELDREGISVLSVNGVAFMPYIKVFSALGIPVVVRTDSDIQKNKLGKYYLSGLSRAANIFRIFTTQEPSSDLQNLVDERFDSLPFSAKVASDIDTQRDILTKSNIFLSHKDLETDLMNGPTGKDLEDYYKSNGDDLYKKMTAKKGVNMYDFLFNKKDCLSKLKGDPLAAPLEVCKEIANKQNENHPYR